MSNSDFLTPIQLEMAETIKQGILNLKQEGTELNILIKELQNKMILYGQTTNRQFKFLNDLGYYTFKDNDSVERFKIYELCMKICDLLLQRETSINYTIYYTDSEGKTYRQANKHFAENEIGGSSKLVRPNIGPVKEQLMADKNKTDLTEHYNKFIDILNGKTPNRYPNKSITKGHISEAFERHVVKLLKITDDISKPENPPISIGEAWFLVRQSKGITPWYVSGDVGATQVKDITAGTPRLSRNSTLRDIASYLIYLYNIDDNILDEVSKNAISIFKDETKEDFETIAKYVEKDAIEEVKKYFEDMKKNN